MWEAFSSPPTIYEARAPWREIREDLLRLAKAGRLVEQRYKWWLLASEISFAGLFFSFPVVFITSFNGVPVLGWVVSATLFALFAVALYMTLRLTDRRTEPHRAEVVLGWGECVGRDAPRKARWRIRLDLRRTHSPFFETARRSSLDPKTKIETTRIEYSQKWLDVSGRLKDGTQFRTTVVQRVKSREKPHRKGVKVREKFEELVAATISGRPGEPPLDDKLPSLPHGKLDPRSQLKSRRMQKGKLEASVIVRQIRTQRRGAVVNPHAELQLADRDVLLRLFVVCYRGRRLAQRKQRK
ncbi:MAG TPA: hypothetical protein VGE52_17135 [Pirellulales bacterium]